MYKHLFKLMWNKRKQNFLLLSEILVSFMVMFALFSFLTFYFNNYRKPIGLEYNKVWVVDLDDPEMPKQPDSALMYLENLQAMLRFPQIEAVGLASSNVPYASTVWTTGLTYNGKNFSSINDFIAGYEFQKVWGMEMAEGRWYNQQDLAMSSKPVVINETLKKEIFGNDKAVGKILSQKNKMVVVGVARDVKNSGDFWPSGKAIYLPVDTSNSTFTNALVLRVKSNADAAFEGQIYTLLSKTLKNANVRIRHSDEMRRDKNSETIIPMIISVVIAAFLLINVALGLFGVMWYNISKRKGEIGLRRAIGASGSRISWQLVTESIILATMSLALGTFFAIQFPLLNVFNVASGVYVTAIVLAILFIYLLVLVCSLYPGKQAAAIRPAVALHEE